jgi:hypothetical protein
MTGRVSHRRLCVSGTVEGQLYTDIDAAVALLLEKEGDTEAGAVPVEGAHRPLPALLVGPAGICRHYFCHSRHVPGILGIIGCFLETSAVFVWVHAEFIRHFSAFYLRIFGKVVGISGHNWA